MKVGMLLPANFAVGSPGNGIRIQAERQADALAALGHEVVRLISWDRHDLKSFDVIHFFLGGGANIGIERELANYTGLVVFAPIIDSNEPNWRYRLAAMSGNILDRVSTIPSLFRRQAMFAGLVIVRSSHERDRVVRGLGIDARKVRIVLNGVKPPAPANKQLAQGLLRSDEPYILQVGAFTQQRKNAVRLAQAAAAECLPLVIAGKAAPGQILDRLREIAAASPDIRLLEWVDESTLQSLYANCRVLALPSLHEGTGLVALEAAAHGAKVIITKNGGPPDYFRKLAWYVDPLSFADIRGAIRQAWEAPAEDQRLKQHVLENLTWEQSARQLVEVYREFS